MKIGTREFGGMVPRAEPHLLTESQAQLASNSKIWRGGLQPLRLISFIANLAKVGTIRTIYRFGQNLDSDTQYWFHWLNDTNATTGPIPDDPNERTYYTEAGQPPKVTDLSIALGGTSYPVISYLLGIPTPLLQAITVTGGTADTGAIAQTTSVVYTYVSGWGEEGPPSAASTLFSLTNGQYLTVQNMSGPPSGAYNIVSKRIYIGQTAGGVQNYTFWTEVPVGTAVTTAAFNFGQLAESLPNPYLSPPPSDLFGLLAHPNGFLVGFSGKRICRSEVNRPHGWPDAYKDPVSHNIVGGAIIGSSLVVCSTKDTYIAVGTDPINFQIIKLEIEQPCVSKRSIVAADGAVLYASPDGLISVSASGAAVNITQNIFTPDQWQEFKPESISAYFFKGSYLAFYDNGIVQAGFVIDALQSEVYYLNFYATAGYSDPRRNALFLAQGQQVMRFDPPIAVNSQAMLWRSKKYIMDTRTTFGAARVIATAYPLTLRLYCDNVLVHTQIVTSKDIFSLAMGYRAREAYYELATAITTSIQECLIVTQSNEFKEAPYSGPRPGILQSDYMRP